MFRHTFSAALLLVRQYYSQFALPSCFTSCWRGDCDHGHPWLYHHYFGEDFRERGPQTRGPRVYARRKGEASIRVAIIRIIRTALDTRVQCSACYRDCLFCKNAVCYHVLNGILVFLVLEIFERRIRKISTEGQQGL